MTVAWVFHSLSSHNYQEERKQMSLTFCNNKIRPQGFEQLAQCVGMIQNESLSNKYQALGPRYSFSTETTLGFSSEMSVRGSKSLNSHNFSCQISGGPWHKDNPRPHPNSEVISVELCKAGQCQDARARTMIGSSAYLVLICDLIRREAQETQQGRS